jgi:hypothetical protein
VVELLLARRRQPARQGTERRLAHAHGGALEGKTDVVLLFLSKGVDINLGDESAGPRSSTPPAAATPSW